MKKINNHLLAGRSILAFHIAARELSFTRAARVLHIGQSAVSHSVRQLEERLGVALFERRNQGVRLTKTGEALAMRLQRGFSEIEAGLSEAQASIDSSQTVTISVSTSLASHWLMPRIARFKQAYPGIQLRCITQDTDHELFEYDFDLCIPLGQVSWQGFQRWRFTDEVLYPVCSPDYLLRSAPLSAPQDLLNQQLIHLEERYAPRFSWQQYFRYYDLDTEQYGSRLSRGSELFNDYSIVVQAAVEGQGVALGWQHIVGPLIEQGRLLAPLAEHICTEHPFYIIAPEDKPMRPETRALLEWLLMEISGLPLSA